ncbi:MAG TPA: D-aminoacylase [Candidatus Dormibacteraeota bacterium]|nr:D-aminoacylase [Candidatus Dormibacteraeota bacterium]
MPVLVRGTTVLDGTGTDGVAADVLLRDGVVAALGPALPKEPGAVVVDGSGLVLAPGFIDMHSHSDLYTLVASADGLRVGDDPKLLQGVTTQVFGQDGISMAPVGDHDVAAFADFVAGLDGFLDPAAWSWRGVGEYLDTLRRRSTTRVAGLVGHSTVRRLVMGMEARPPRPAELEAMCAAVDRAMREGALGLSTGLVYAPAAYATTDELVALATVVAGHGGRLFIHVRNESHLVLEATAEALEVARRSGVHLHYSHIKTAGRANWHRVGQMLEMIDDYRRQGVVVTCDIHPYVAGSTTASVLLPPWILADGLPGAVRQLADPAVRARVRTQLLEDTTSWDNWWVFSGGWDGLRIAGVSEGSSNTGLQGRPLAELIAAAGVADPLSPAGFDVLFDLLAAERLQMSVISFNNTEGNIARFIGQPFCSVGSDALVNPGGHPHPRLYGCFPRVLRTFVREQGTLSLPEAVHAMTGRAAAAMGRPELGRVAVGAPADLVLFDPLTVADRATYEAPRTPPTGIQQVWIGGRTVVRDGRVLAPTPDQPMAPALSAGPGGGRP